MTRFLATLLASGALYNWLPLPAHAELEVVGLKGAIARSVESEYQNSRRSTRTFTPIPKSRFRRRRRRPS